MYECTPIQKRQINGIVAFSNLNAKIAFTLIAHRSYRCYPYVCISPIQARHIWFQSILSALSCRMQHSIDVHIWNIWNGVCAQCTKICTMSSFRRKYQSVCHFGKSNGLHGLQLILTKILPIFS